MRTAMKFLATISVLIPLQFITAACGRYQSTPAATQSLPSSALPTPAPVTPTLAVSLVTPTVCLPDAAFVSDVTVPDGTAYQPGTTFSKTWRVLSKPCAPWPDGTKLVFVSGDQLGATSSVPIPNTALGQTADLSVDMAAPDTDGTYRGDWRMQGPSGESFGDSLYVMITVSSGTATPVVTAADTSVPPPAEAAQTHILYFYAGLETCPYSRLMGPKVERLYQNYGPIALLPSGRHAGLAAPGALPAIQQTRRGVEFYLVPVPGWGTNVASFREPTGVSFPVASDPGLSVDTSQIPVVVVYNKQTSVMQVATVGDVPYVTLSSRVDAIVAGGSPAPATGRA